jgi:hypothetical protein
MLSLDTFFYRSLLLSTIGGLLALGCQGPDPLYRNSATELLGAAGSNGLAGHSGEAGSGATGTGAVGSGVGGASAAGSTGQGGSPGAAGNGITGTAGTIGTAGQSGGAGTTGMLGAAGTGGAQGAAGATGAGGAPSASKCPGCVIEVEAECQNGTSKQEIKVYLALVNEKATPVDLTQLTLRYWFTRDDTTSTPGLAVDYAQAPFTAAEVTAKYVPVSPALTGANTYLQIGFAAATPALTGFTTSGELELRLNDYSTASWDSSQSDDYSFQACAGTATAYASPFNGKPWSRITAYFAGELLYGTEPTVPTPPTM